MYRLDTETQIFFYENEYYVFSNFSSFAIDWKGKTYMTSEHVYHSEKFDNENIKEEIRDTKSAHDAMLVARLHKDKQVSNWDEIKLNVMKSILIQKVLQHPYVKEKLLESGGKELVEDSWRDDFWGWGPNKNGQNHLGKIWMEVRDEFKNQN
ncbi:MAG: NADAR family protein [Patescibacteria group bacterium]